MGIVSTYVILKIPKLRLSDSVVLERLPPGKRRKSLEAWVQHVEHELFANRFLMIDQATAHEFARVLARRERLGRPIRVMDALIAATVLAQGATLATRDVSDFAGLGLDIINPFEAPASG
jgi:predicted nucleic acid-binding protein